MDYIDNILGQYGFGESVSLGGKTTRIETDVEPDHQAYAECYAYALRDEVMMENEKLAMHIEVAKIRAAGEDLKEMTDKVKDKVNEGKNKIKKFLLELYDKVIRFFTETVRYFFSNEKKLGKMISQMKAALKRTVKSNEGEVKIADYTSIEKKVSMSESYYGYGEAEDEEEKKIAGAIKDGEDYLEKYSKKKGRTAINKDINKALSRKIESSDEIGKVKEGTVVIGLIFALATLEVTGTKTLKEAEKILKELPEAEKAEYEKKIQSVLQKYASDVDKREAALRQKLSGNAANEITSSEIDAGIDTVLALKNKEGDEISVKDACDSLIEKAREGVKELNQVISDAKSSLNEKVTVSIPDAYEGLKKGLEDLVKAFEDIRSGGTRMKAINSKIRKLVEKKRKIQEKIKNNKDENDGLALQKERVTLIASIKLLNIFKDKQEKFLGFSIFMAQKVLEDFAKVSK